MMPHVVLAVVGTPRSGKSTFIQHALDLKKPPSSNFSTKKVSLEGAISILNMQELSVDEISINPNGSIRWPGGDEYGDIINKVDGVLMIYDTGDIGSTEPVPALLRESNPIPAILEKGI